ncbi:uncharacterized protein LOC108089284 [Drosophila ficusphila]|uniref:uncharacterized protein LOC108089284 n=1 Tax=Drosophila ficusphila TaxID=30025 RepID=UPI0007E7E0C8|nr:uncharacterized protein LOC108089284 [Drosophila ficusphila]
MSATNIEELYDDCLYHIMDYLSTEDRISFAQVCRRFRQVFTNGNNSKYSDFTIDLNSTRKELIQFCICREEVKSLTIDLDHFELPKHFRKYGCVSPVKCFEILCLNLSGMNNLMHLIVKQKYKLTMLADKPFDQILSAVRHLPKLKKLKIQARDDCRVDCLSQLHHIEDLEILIPKIPNATLVKCCKSNANLLSLQLGYSCVQKDVRNIVPHCKNLEVLKFGMPGKSSDYVAVARLPKLRKLTYYGIRGIGSFEALLSVLAIKNQLTHLAIDCGSLVMQEIRQLIRIQNLRYLKCFSSTIECVEMLACLSNLEELWLSMSSPLDISNALLLVIANCKNLKSLRVSGGIVNAKIISDATREINFGKSGESADSLLKLILDEYTKK